MPDIILGGFSTDVTPPEVTAWAPTGTGVARAANVVFDIWDEETGVDTDSLNVTVGGVDAVIAGVIQLADFTGSITDMGSGTWRVTLNPNVDFLSYATIDVKVNAQDLAPSPNIMDEFSWSFQVEDYEPPYVENNSPTGVDVPVTTLVEFDLKDDGTGVNIQSVTVTIGGTLAYDGTGVVDPDDGFQPDFQGASSAITGTPTSYHFAIDADPNYSEYVEYEVIVNADDLAP